MRRDLIDIDQASTKRRCLEGDSKFRLHAEWTGCRFRYECHIQFNFPRVCCFHDLLGRWCWVGVFWRVWIGTFDLNKAFRADRLIATSGSIEVRRIIQEAYRTLEGVLVKISLKGLAIDIWVFGQHRFLGKQFGLCAGPRGGCRECSQSLGPTT